MVGDLLLDVYIKGVSTRLTPEAPVPVVDVMQRTIHLGGAANAASNLRSLSASVTFCTVLGKDPAADDAIQLFKSSGIDTSSVLVDEERQTIVKTRVVSGDRILVRYDEGTVTEISAATEISLKQVLIEQYAQYDAVLVSDYDKGILTQEIINTLVELQRVHKKFLVVDSKRLPDFASTNPNLIKPNYEEAIALCKSHRDYNSRIDHINALGEMIYNRTRSHFAAVTLDNEGSVIFEKGKHVHRCSSSTLGIATNASGAGDTYISALMLAYLSCGDICHSAEIAHAAATIVVAKNDTASCAVNELKSYFSQGEKCLYNHDDLESLCELYRNEGKQIVFTNGCFDILHSGHVSYLNQARALGDVLIVGVNNDASIRRLKGESRPINPLSDRLEVLCGLSSVSHVIPFGSEEDDTPISLIKKVRPSIFVKGGDYSIDQLPEASTIADAGGKIIFIPLVPDHSTTKIIHRIYTPAAVS